MEKHLDKFIKDKLSKQHFPLDDEAWENMESILDRQVPPNTFAKDKPFKLYKLAGLLCLLVLCYTIYTFSYKTRNNKKIELNKIESIASSDKGNETLIAKDDQIVVADISASKSNETNSKQKEKEQAAIESKTVIDNIEEPISKEKVPTQNFELNKPLQSTKKPIDFNQFNNQKIDASKSEAIVNAANLNSEKLMLHEELRSTISSLRNINSLGINYLNIPANSINGPEVESAIKIIPEIKRPTLGVYIASQTFDKDRSYNFGLHHRYFINSNLAISVEPAYSYKPLEISSIAKDSSEFVSFGANMYEQEIVGQSIHAVQVPAILEYHFSNKIYLASGFSYNRILALGANKQTKVDGLVTEEKKIWLDREFYTNTYYRANVSLAYMLNAHTSLDVQYEFPMKKTALFNEESSIGLKLKLYL